MVLTAEGAGNSAIAVGCGMSWRARIIERNVALGLQGAEDLEEVMRHGYVTTPIVPCDSTGHDIARCLTCCPALPRSRAVRRNAD